MNPSRRQLANAIRALSMDAVQKANSGHPGCPMGMADIAEVLWRDYLKHNPQDPNWVNRDRFVLSNGHGSMLIYSLLHLTGYDLPKEELMNFRQLHSKTPGHPEYGMTPGVETTTGPLGQGLANGVGMALAEQVLGNQFNTDQHKVIDHHTYVFAGDGCLMEGISHEACSLAGTLGLGKLIVFYDNNGISIDGEVKKWFTDDTPARFESYGWHVVRNVDGHDSEAIKKAIDAARANTTQPTLIDCRTIIGFGAPNAQGKEKCHGAPLGDEEIANAREMLGWEYPPFVIPEAYQAAWDAKAKGAEQQAGWQRVFDAYQSANPKDASELTRRWQGKLPENWAQYCQELIQNTQQAQKKVATRKASQQVLESLSEICPELFGGSADLSGSNLTIHGASQVIEPGKLKGNYVHYGVREFAMAAMMNGIALYGGFIPYGGTFLVFADYCRNAIRLSALMKLRTIYVFSHDSIGLGEDGPTHQPIEHLTMLRATPNLHNWRPCDATETAVAWQEAIEYQGPTALCLSRQGIPAQKRDAEQVAAIKKGGYILKTSETKPHVVVVSTGSEVALCQEAMSQVKGLNIQLVSMPCCEVFDAQPTAYQEEVLPTGIPTLVVEAGASLGWYKYLKGQGKIIGIDRFGESAPIHDVYAEMGLTAQHIAAAIEELAK